MHPEARRHTDPPQHQQGGERRAGGGRGALERELLVIEHQFNAHTLQDAKNHATGLQEANAQGKGKLELCFMISWG